MKDLLNITEFAKSVDRSRQWIYELIKRGDIKITVVGNRPFINKGYQKDLKK